jgi:hypothetical protein
MRFRVPGTPAPTFATFVAETWEFSEYIEISKEWREFIDTTYLEQVEFMNNTYDADWTYTPVEVYFVDLAESNLGFPIGGVFDPNTNQVYLSKNLLDKSPKNLSAYELSCIVHEGYHYLQFSNNGSVVFGLRQGKKQLGLLFSEAMTNLAAMKYLEYIGEEDAAISISQNGYASVMLICQLLELTCPGLMISFGSGDLTSIQKEFNCLCKAHIENPREDEFAKLLQSCDLLYENEKESQKENQEVSKEAVFVALYHLLQDIEILAAITEISNEEAFRSFINKYSSTQGELLGGEHTKFIEYFSSIHYTEPEIEPATAD